MARVNAYMLRHQAAGILTDKVFAETPTQAQMDEAAKRLERRHGAKHPKTEEPYWMRIQPTVLEVPDAIAHAFVAAPPEEPEPGDLEPGTADAVPLPEVKISGTGTVTNPEK